jgi:hypothetical protein
MALTTAEIEDAKPGITPHGRTTTKSYKIGDAAGLYLQLTPTGGKWWRFKYRFGGREKRLALGVYPDVSLIDARRSRDLYRSMLAEGIDPSEHVRMARAARIADAARQIAATRLTLDDEGALTFRLGTRRLSLTPDETNMLRDFLDATRSVGARATSCS